MELTFTLGNAVTIIIGLVSVVAFIWAIKVNIAKLESKCKELDKEVTHAQAQILRIESEYDKYIEKLEDKAEENTTKIFDSITAVSIKVDTILTDLKVHIAGHKNI